jgi:hypothetical protein
MLPFSWYENATAAIRDQNHAKWQSIPTPRPLLVVQTQAPLWGVNRPKEQRGATHRRGTRSHPFTSTLLPYIEALYSALMNLNSSPCAFPLLCWLKKGEDLHDLLRKFQVLMTSPVLLLPVAVAGRLFLRTFGKIDNVMLSDISQRKIPLLLQIMLFSVLITKSITVDRFPDLYYFFLGGLLSTIVAFLLLYLN